MISNQFQPRNDTNVSLFHPMTYQNQPIIDAKKLLITK